MSGTDRQTSPAPTVDERLDRIERAIAALAWWLVEAQTGFAKRDAEAVTAIMRGERD